MFISLEHFEIDKIQIFVDITLSTCNFSDLSLELYGVHWQPCGNSPYRWVSSASILYQDFLVYRSELNSVVC